MRCRRLCAVFGFRHFVMHVGNAASLRRRNACREKDSDRDRVIAWFFRVRRSCFAASRLNEPDSRSGQRKNRRTELKRGGCGNDGLA